MSGAALAMPVLAMAFALFDIAKALVRIARAMEKQNGIISKEDEV
jgi:hypothetical protein